MTPTDGPAFAQLADQRPDTGRIQFISRYWLDPVKVYCTNTTFILNMP
jgi:hypothetical protein